MVMGRQLFASEAYAKTKSIADAFHAIFPGTRTWFEAPSSCGLHVFSLSLSLSKNTRRAVHKTRKARRRISDIIGMRSQSAARPVGRASETLFKGGFTLFLETLFRPGGTDLAVVGVLLVYRAERRNDDGRKRGREIETSHVGRKSLSFTSRIEHN